jgi:DNA polymerase-3 subunit beta
MIVLKAPQEKLLDALQSVAGIVERRHTLPILANVLLRKNGVEDIEFTTSDLEIQVRTARRRSAATPAAQHHGGRAQADRHPAQPAGRPGGHAQQRANKLTLQAARAASRCRPCRPTTSRWSTRRPTSAVPSACRRRRCAPDQPGALRDGGARHPLLPQRHPVHRRRPHADPGGHRRPPPGAGPGHAGADMPQAGSHPAAQDRARAAAPAEGRRHAHRDALCRQPGQVRFSGMEFVTKLVEGKFPDYNRVIPKNHKNAWCWAARRCWPACSARPS